VHIPDSVEEKAVSSSRTFVIEAGVETKILLLYWLFDSGAVIGRAGTRTK
jgi:hypothetical protein